MAESVATTFPVRYALYYPYIHIRDVNWLKSTILCFQQVRRMVPLGFTLRDLPFTKPFMDLEGPAGPLLQAANLYSSPVEHALLRLQKKISDNLDRFKELYSEKNTPSEYQAGPKAFEIHKDKLIASLPENLLLPNGLAWVSRDESKDWLTVHRDLGSAIMTIIGLSVGTAEGLDIVTPNSSVHYSLLANREEDVFDALLKIDKPELHEEAEVDSADLAQVVVTTGFDLTRLTPQNIKDLVSDGKDLRKFLGKVESFSSEIPKGLSPEERKKRVKAQADAILSEWNSYHMGLPKFAKEAIIEKAAEKIPEKAVEILPVAAGATLTSAVVGVLPGVVVSLVTAGGISMYKNRKSPFRYLNRINKAVDKSIGSIYVPQWRKLAGVGA